MALEYVSDMKKKDFVTGLFLCLSAYLEHRFWSTVFGLPCQGLYGLRIYSPRIPSPRLLRVCELSRRARLKADRFPTLSLLRLFVCDTMMDCLRTERDRLLEETELLLTVYAMAEKPDAPSPDAPSPSKGIY